MRTFAASLLLTFCSLAFAQGAPDAPSTDPLRNAFSKLDRNADGYISKVEALGDAEVRKRFKEFDADADGRLSEREFAAVRDDIQKRALVDATITARVKAALLAERGIPSMSISVETHEASVMLTGFVGSPDIVSRAGRVTASVNGVRSVHNAITVKN